MYFFPCQHSATNAVNSFPPKPWSNVTEYLGSKSKSRAYGIWDALLGVPYCRLPCVCVRANEWTSNAYLATLTYLFRALLTLEESNQNYKVVACLLACALAVVIFLIYRIYTHTSLEYYICTNSSRARHAHPQIAQ